jgi:hypothetical protein
MTLWLSYAEGPKSEPQALGTEFGRRLNYLLVTEYQPSKLPLTFTYTFYLYLLLVPYFHPPSTLPLPYLHLLPLPPTCALALRIIFL